MKLSGVMIGTENAKTLGEFYTKIFGTPGWNQDDWYGFDVSGGTLMIGPHSEVHGKSQEPPRIIICVETDDVKGDFEKFTSCGAAIIAEPYTPAGATDGFLATVADPDGNLIQLMTPWRE